MKKKTTLVLIILLSLLSVQNSFGQEEAVKENSNFKFGLGVSLYNLTENEFVWDIAPVNSVYLTFDFGDSFRLEPVLGFARENGSFEYYVELGGFGKKSISKFNILYGLRLGTNYADMKLIAPSIGGEYFFIDHFSIGTEIQARGILMDRELLAFTNTTVIIRFYF